MSSGTRQNNKREDRKIESNDSPEIPDMGGGGASEETGLLSGRTIIGKTHRQAA